MEFIATRYHNTMRCMENEESAFLCTHSVESRKQSHDTREASWLPLIAPRKQPDEVEFIDRNEREFSTRHKNPYLFPFMKTISLPLHTAALRSNSTCYLLSSRAATAATAEEA
jgi:hypothetical protein